MPDKKERDLWWHFLSGKPEHVWNPPKSKKKIKSKQKQRDQSTQEPLRAWDGQARENVEIEHEHECTYDEIQEKQDVTPSETPNVAVNAGDFEITLKSEPQDFLPTPTGTPIPSDNVEQMAEPGPSSLINEQDPENDYLTPREPSPQLLKLIDEVIPPS